MRRITKKGIQLVLRYENPLKGMQNKADKITNN